jgi:hypothetical protein
MKDRRTQGVRSLHVRGSIVSLINISIIYYQITIFDALYTYKEKIRIENRAYSYDRRLP